MIPPLQVPVALIIFNRPETTKRVVTEIAKARPSRLLVIADGPRPDHPEDAELCRQARAIIDQRVDWECEISRNYSDVNLGCGYRPATGISWAFGQVEEAIILEDDCVPHPDFFRFCEELLRKYRDDERVMIISGRNAQPARRGGAFSYSFRRMMSCWGWATWRRAWRHHDMELQAWPALKDTGWLSDILGHQKGAEYWARIFDEAVRRRGHADYWDYQWAFACWTQNGFAIVPEVNLVRNVGFGPNATHTRGAGDARGQLAAGEMTFPLRHPLHLIWDRQGDDRLLDQLAARLSRKRAWRWRIVQTIKRLSRNLRAPRASVCDG